MATSRYSNMKVHISDSQKDKIKTAVEDNTAVSIRFNHEHLTGIDVLAFTQSQLNKMKDAHNNNKGTTIKMSKTQVQHNKQIEGGFLGTLLAGVASAVLVSVASYVWVKITGKGLYIKRGNDIVKVKQFGDGLWLRPYKRDTCGAPQVVGEGLFMKTGQGYEQLNIAQLKELLK
jgi:hypothetical protein